MIYLELRVLPRLYIIMLEFRRVFFFFFPFTVYLSIFLLVSVIAITMMMIMMMIIAFVCVTCKFVEIRVLELSIIFVLSG